MDATMRSTQPTNSEENDEYAMALPIGSTGHCCRRISRMETKTPQYRAPPAAPPNLFSKKPAGSRNMDADAKPRGTRRALVTRTPIRVTGRNIRKKPAAACLSSPSRKGKTPGPMRRPKAPPNPTAAKRKAKEIQALKNPATSPAKAPDPHATAEYYVTTSFIFPV